MLVAATVLWHAVVGCCAHHHHVDSVAHPAGSCCGSVVDVSRCEHGEVEGPSHDQTAHHQAAHDRARGSRSVRTFETGGDSAACCSIFPLDGPGTDPSEQHHDDCADGECVLAVGLIETRASFVSLLDSAVSTGRFGFETVVRPEPIRIVSSTSENLGDLSVPRGLRRHLSLGKLTC